MSVKVTETVSVDIDPKLSIPDLSPEEFRYGWEWPTRAQWRDGQRYGFCWAPD